MHSPADAYAECYPDYGGGYDLALGDSDDEGRDDGKVCDQLCTSAVCDFQVHMPSRLHRLSSRGVTSSRRQTGASTRCESRWMVGLLVCACTHPPAPLHTLPEGHRSGAQGARRATQGAAAAAREPATQEQAAEPAGQGESWRGDGGAGSCGRSVL